MTEAPNRTIPSGLPGATPRGKKTEVSSRASGEMQRQLRRENESATILALMGYDVEQNPPTLPNGKNPDYKIEGQIFDHYTPPTSNPDQIRKGISRKVKRRQAERIVLNLDDTNVNPDELQDILARKPIDNLKEIIMIINGKVIPFFP
ncbi:hypothetical protein [Moorena sp. SIO4G3]|uniref:CdiA C-terminal domain-containing protein n=1 Tax=Moorena sp. SIO4G3 TaxID=2607821 RepID=UPI00142B60A1|nr:hypothetical protein [Moorena sp. SIO4G3]NEO76428.1 hypothetical protein [Moorena sp. SIO4G3]